MKIPIKFAELHAPLFLAGKNFGMKLEPTSHRHAGLTLIYDQAEKELLVSWKDEAAILPSSTVHSMTVDYAQAKVTAKEVPASAAPAGKATAQAATPQSHVFAGPGHGETGLDKAKGKVVL